MPLAGARANASCRVFLRTGTAPRLWVSRGEDGEWGALRAARSRGCGFVPRGTDEAKLGLGWGFCQYLVPEPEGSATYGPLRHLQRLGGEDDLGPSADHHGVAGDHPPHGRAAGGERVWQDG